jgi:hypothetical protein
MLKAERNLEGIPRGRFSAQIKALSTQSWEDVFTGDAASQLEAPHRNGGAEGSSISPLMNREAAFSSTPR